MADTSCPTCGGKFQDLPPDKYPRAYSDQEVSRLATEGSKSSYGSPGAGPALNPLPSSSKWTWDRNDNLQAGERIAADSKKEYQAPSKLAYRKGR